MNKRVRAKALPVRDAAVEHGQRTWSDGDKLAIVREMLAPGAVTQVAADRHGIGAGLLHSWRKQMPRVAMTGFAAMEIRPKALPAPQVTEESAPPGRAVMFDLPMVLSAVAAGTSSIPGLIEMK